MKTKNPFNWSDIMARLAPPAPVITFEYDDEPCDFENCDCSVTNQSYDQAMTLQIGNKEVRISVAVDVL